MTAPSRAQGALNLAWPTQELARNAPTTEIAENAMSATRTARCAGARGATSSRRMSEASTGGRTGGSRVGIRFADAGSDDVNMGGGGVGGSAISGAPVFGFPWRYRLFHRLALA